MKLLASLAACALAGGLAGGPARAQPAAAPAGAASATVTLRPALEAAWQRATAAREVEGQRRRAEADRLAAARPWAAAPSLELSHRDGRLQGDARGRETEAGVSVPLWLPGQRSAQAASADAAATLAAASERVARLRLAGDLREAAWRAAALKAEVQQLEAQSRSLQQLADDVERRVRAGDLARADSLAARAEHLAATASLTDARQRLQAEQARWTLLTGLAALPDLTEADGPADPPAQAAAHPEWQLAAQSTELARKRLDLVRHARRDAPELSLGVRQDTGGRGEARQGSVVLALRLPFGTEDRNRPLEAAAFAELDIAQTHERRLRERLYSEIATAREAARSAQAQLEAETARAGLLRERAALIDKSFRAGEAPLPDLLRAHAAAAQADGAVARHTAALGLARARLQQAHGLLP